MATTQAPKNRNRWTGSAWIPPVLLLTVAYGLLGLTFAEQLSHSALMSRCVLMDPNLSRIWSVANIEVGLSYLGVFLGMLYYFLRLYRLSKQHLSDLGFACAYVLVSFGLDYACVRNFHPFVAMLIGDAVVMTFTVAVSRQLWFQRLLGVFVPIVFVSCAVGHFLEGLSYWHLTYPINVPWTMVTADVGFAVLVNSARFPGLIRGEDVSEELKMQRERVERLEYEISARTEAETALRLSEQRRVDEAARRESFAKDVMLAVTGNKLRLHSDSSGLPVPLRNQLPSEPFTARDLSSIRTECARVAAHLEFPHERVIDLVSAVSETLMNAVVHAQSGTITISSDSTTVQVRVSDTGTGMDWETLPYATLQSGWSSKGTLGMGFTLMSLADSIDIFTTPTGTTVILTMGREQPVQFRLDK